MDKACMREHNEPKNSKSLKTNRATWSPSPESTICRNSFAWTSPGGFSVESRTRFALGINELTAQNNSHQQQHQHQQQLLNINSDYTCYTFYNTFISNVIKWLLPGTVFWVYQSKRITVHTSTTLSNQGLSTLHILLLNIDLIQIKLGHQ